MSGHTPKPWFLRENTDSEFPPVVQRGRSGGFEVLDSDKERALADARLISAAPDLLEACQAARALTPDGTHTAKVMDEAIKAATGGAE